MGQATAPRNGAPHTPMSPLRPPRHAGGARFTAELRDLAAEELTELRDFLLGVLRPRVRNDEDAEDLVQGALLKALGERELRCLRAWTRTVVLRDSITLLQRTRQRDKRLGRRIDLERAYLPVRSADEPEDEELHEKVQAAVEHLPYRFREFVRLRHVGLTFKKIGNELGVPAKTASRRFKAACKLLRKELRPLVGR